MLPPDISKIFNWLQNEANALHRFDTQAVLSHLQKTFEKHPLDPQQTIALRKFLEETSIVLNKIKNDKYTMDQLHLINLRYQAFLKAFFSEEQRRALPPLFTVENKIEKEKKELNVVKKSKNEFFSGLTNFLNELSRPDGNPQEALGSFLGVLVKIVISVLIGFIKPLLGKGAEADQKANLLEDGFSKVFSNMINQKTSPEKENLKSFTPAHAKSRANSKGSSSRPTGFVDTEEAWTLDKPKNRMNTI